MTAPSPTKELDEAIDAVLDLAIRVKAALADGRVTLDEVLSGITDGKVRDSLENFIKAIQATISGPDRPSPWDLITVAADAVLELVGHLRDALEDGKVTPDEIVHGVTDGHIRQSLLDAIDGADKIPAELSAMSPWTMIGTFQRIAAKLPQLLAS